MQSETCLDYGPQTGKGGRVGHNQREEGGVQGVKRVRIEPHEGRREWG